MISSIAAVLLYIIFVPVNSAAELKVLTDTELKATSGRQGMTDFSVSNDTARIFLDVHIQTFGTVDSFKAGHYNNGTTTGWDNDWTGVTIGSEQNPVTVDGLVFVADFDNISSADKTLQRLVIGTNRIQGSVSGTINSYTGVYNDALTGGTGNPVYCNRTNLGATTFNFDSNASETENMGMFMVLTLDGAHPGIQMISGYDEKTMNSTFAAGEWWDSP